MYDVLPQIFRNFFVLRQILQKKMAKNNNTTQTTALGLRIKLRCCTPVNTARNSHPALPEKTNSQIGNWFWNISDDDDGDKNSIRSN